MDKAAPAIVRLAEFAKLHAVSKAAITKWKARGLLVLTPDGRVDVLASNRLLADRPVVQGRPAKGPTAPPSSMSGETWTTAEAVRRERIAVAQLRELELAREAGLVVPKADVVGVVRGEYAIVRTAMLGMASKLAARLAAAKTPEEAGTLVDVEVRSILDGLTADGAK